MLVWVRSSVRALFFFEMASVSVRLCICVLMRVCTRACVCVRVRVCVCVRTFICVCLRMCVRACVCVPCESVCAAHAHAEVG